MTYATELAAAAKSPSVVWDFEVGSARFVTREHSGLTTPGGYTVFPGARPRRDTGSRLDIRKGRLTVSEASFAVPDPDGVVTAWLANFDAVLSQSLVVRRNGFVGLAESGFLVSYWVFEDWRVWDGKAGGYVFELSNVLKPMTRGLFEEFDGERYALESGGGTLSSSATTITLETSPKGVWREPGFALLVDSAARFHELVEYQTIGGTGDKDLQTVTRRKYGVGSNPSAYTFADADTDVFHVWARRANPINLMLELLTTTDFGTNPAAGENLTETGFENWTGGNPDDWTVETQTGNVTEETTTVHGGSSAVKCATTDRGSVYGRVRQDQVLVAGAEFEVGAWAYHPTAGRQSDPVVRFRNVTRGQYWNPSTQLWVPTETNMIVGTITRDVWVELKWTVPTTGTGFEDTDTYRLELEAKDGVGHVIFDDATVFGLASNGSYDQGDGDGLGIDVDLIDVSQWESLRDTYYPAPTFDGSDNLTAGKAVLFVSKEPIDDVKEWVEDHILLPWAILPGTDERERFTGRLYGDVFSVALDVGDGWLKHEFDAGQYERGWARRVNNIRRQSDWDEGNDKYSVGTNQTSGLSVSQFGKSKLTKLMGKGHRSGRLGFKDYSGQLDLASATSRLLLELANPGPEFRVAAFYAHKDIGLGEFVSINVPVIPDLATGSRGFAGGLFMVVERRLDDASGLVELRLRERRLVFRVAYVAPDSVASSYSAASAADRQYWYFAPGDSNAFDNDDPAYVVA